MTTPSPAQAATRPAALPDAQAPDGLPVPQRYWSVLSVQIAMAITVMTAAMVNVALPFIAIDFAAAPATVIWVVSGQQLAIVATLLPFSALGERLGYAGVYRFGLVAFLVATLLCAFAPNIEVLIAARVVQGLAIAAVTAVTAGLLRLSVPRAQFGRIVSMNALTLGISAAIGPGLGSFFLSFGNWQWLVGFPVPFALLAWWIARRSLPANVQLVAGAFDWRGTLLTIFAAGLIFSSAGALHEHLVLGLIGLLLGALVAAWLVKLSLAAEMHSHVSVLPLDLMRITTLRNGLIASACMFAAQLAGTVSLPFMLYQNGYGIAESGMLLTLFPVGWVGAAAVAGPLADRLSVRALTSFGGLCMVVSLVALASPGSATNRPVLMAGIALLGIGFALFQNPNNRVLIISAPRHRLGSAGGLQAMARMTGQLIGTTGATLVFGMVQHNAPSVALWMGAGFALIGGLICLRHRGGPGMAGAAHG